MSNGFSSRIPVIPDMNLSQLTNCLNGMAPGSSALYGTSPNGFPAIRIFIPFSGKNLTSSRPVMKSPTVNSILVLTCLFVVGVVLLFPTDSDKATSFYNIIDTCTGYFTTLSGYVGSVVRSTSNGGPSSEDDDDGAYEF